MTKHLSEQKIKQYRARELSADVCFEIYRHINNCEHCRRKVFTLEDLDAAITDVKRKLHKAAEEERNNHPSKATLKAYSTNGLQALEYEMVEIHLEICAQCEGRLADVKKSPLWGKLPGWGLDSYPLRPSKLAVSTLALVIFAALIAVISYTLIDEKTDVAQRTTDIFKPSDLIKQTDAAKQEFSTEHPANQFSSSTPLVTRSPNSKEMKTTEASSAKAKLPKLGSVSASQDIILNDGGVQIAVKSGKLIGVDSIPPTLRDSIVSILTSSHWEPARPRQLTQPSGIFLDGPTIRSEEVKLLNPVGEPLSESTPRLKWKPIPGAGNYDLLIFDFVTKRLVRQIHGLTQTEHQIEPPLDAGHYYWQITPIKDGVTLKKVKLPLPIGQFQILDQSKMADLNYIKRVYPESHLILGIAHARLGLLKEAEFHFQQLLIDNPDSAVAKRLFQSVRATNNKGDRK